MNVARELAELRRLITNVVRRGTVEEVDHGKARARVRIKDGGLSDWLPWTTPRAHASGEGFWWPIEIGERVLILAPGGELAVAVILPALTTADAAPVGTNAAVSVVTHSDGATFSYDREAHHWDVNIPDGTVSINASAGFSFIGDLWLDGNIKATGDITDKVRSMAADRGIYNGHGHPGVASGKAKSKPPTAKQ